MQACPRSPKEIQRVRPGPSDRLRASVHLPVCSGALTAWRTPRSPRGPRRSGDQGNAALRPSAPRAHSLAPPCPPRPRICSARWSLPRKRRRRRRRYRPRLRRPLRRRQRRRGRRRGACHRRRGTRGCPPAMPPCLPSSPTPPASSCRAPAIERVRNRVTVSRIGGSPQ